MSTKTIKVCDGCQAEEPESPTSKYIILWDRSRFDLCDTCNDKLMAYLKQNVKPTHA